MNYEDEQYPDYSSNEDQELKVLFDQAETDSEAYNAIMAELTHRGYDFEPEPSPLAPPSEIIKKCPKTRWWNLLALVIGTGLTIFYLQIHGSFYPIDSSAVIMIYGVLALIISMMYLGSGIRTIIGLKDSKYLLPVVPDIEYWFLTVMWFAMSAFQLYSAIQGFVYFKQNQANIMLSLADILPSPTVGILYGILPSLAMAAFAFFFGLAFLHIALELKRLKRQLSE
ncbi:MAG: hypothetical protein LHW64_03990 [Candidatus Cloacimonetes bacterium]|nr:hypothetical protein [Candidatus Cloacimonadota bacterium]MCB5286947.1 hypothetical protein [Candidatus Cloacimonadota bacterium]MCK9184597.1 hypothetical protein [Candidatus Cloacimonadota bacterium]MCK9584813.1 hypothetical protein [Candidatus Cloacimonadota bacterium]MDY0229267.1 hypothetical protein [Candidatus Cloacimonadaceae bacterium]